MIHGRLNTHYEIVNKEINTQYYTSKTTSQCSDLVINFKL